MVEKIQISYRQLHNLKNMLAGLNNKQLNQDFSDDPGCFKCKKCKVSCPILKEGKYFKSTNTQRSYKIKQHTDCDSTFVIYLATCQKCDGQYVGRSELAFKSRHSRHKYEVKNSIGGIGRHYGGQKGCGYQNISIQIIEKVANGEKALLADRENFWQHQ